MNLAHFVLFELGATQVFNVGGMPDPTNAEEFKNLEYESPREITWDEYIAKYSFVEQKQAIEQIRFERNIRLAKTDWIMTVDNFNTLANKNEWLAYRQALRDLPNNPPTPVWDGDILDFSKMNMPVEPPVIRISPDNVVG